MRIHFTIPDRRPDWFTDVVRCATARSGLPVFVSEGVPERLKALENAILAARRDTEGGPGMRRFMALGILRWPVLLDAVKDLPALEWPVCCLDWDILVCSDLRLWLAKFSDFDYCMTSDKSGNPSAPYLIRDIRPLRAFCSALESAVENQSPSLAWASDMFLWSAVALAHGWKVGDMVKPLDGQTFDNNIGESAGRFVMETGKRSVFENGADVVKEGERKKLQLENGKAYLFEESGARVEAVALHLWDGHKAEIPEFVKGLGL